MDILARLLKHLYPTTYLQNITDIDDKIITRAAEEDLTGRITRHLPASHEGHAVLGTRMSTPMTRNGLHERHYSPGSNTARQRLCLYQNLESKI